MEYISKVFKRTGWLSIIESLIVAILGGLLIWKKEEMASIIFYVFGGMFILAGIIKISIYIYSRRNEEPNTYNIVYGLLAIAIGIIIIACSSAIATILRVAIGVWIIYCAFLRIITSFKLKNTNFKLWIFTLIVALVMLGCGLFIAINSGTIIMVIGILMLVSSVIDITEGIIFVKAIKDVEVEKIEVEKVEEDIGK